MEKHLVMCSECETLYHAVKEEGSDGLTITGDAPGEYAHYAVQDVCDHAPLFVEVVIKRTHDEESAIASAHTNLLTDAMDSVEGIRGFLTAFQEYQEARSGKSPSWKDVAALARSRDQLREALFRLCKD